MQTKELIRRLAEADPSGELECNCGLEDIYYVTTKEYYWDGVAEVLIRDPNNKYYNVVGATYNYPADKVCIVTHSIEDALLENPDLPVEIPFKESYPSGYKRLHEYVEEKRVEMRQIIKDVDNNFDLYKATKDQTDKFFKTTDHKL